MPPCAPCAKSAAWRPASPPPFPHSSKAASPPWIPPPRTKKCLSDRPLRRAPHISHHQPDLFESDLRRQGLPQRLQPLRPQPPHHFLDPPVALFSHPLPPVLQPPLFHQVRHHVDHRRHLPPARLRDLFEAAAFRQHPHRLFCWRDFRGFPRLRPRS